MKCGEKLLSQGKPATRGETQLVGCAQVRWSNTRTPAFESELKPDPVMTHNSRLIDMVMIDESLQPRVTNSRAGLAHNDAEGADWSGMS